jgi:hypothetical protein
MNNPLYPITGLNETEAVSLVALRGVDVLSNSLSAITDDERKILLNALRIARRVVVRNMLKRRGCALPCTSEAWSKTTRRAVRELEAASC